MTTSRRITVALEESDLTRDLILGRVAIEGLRIEPVLVSTEERHERMVAGSEFDACEFSMAQYLALYGGGHCHFTAIPVFPRRMFGQRFLFARVGAGVAEIRDLIGRRVLVSRYHNSLALWLRGYLEHEHGVAPRDVEWVRLRHEAIELDMPPGVAVTDAPAGSTVADLVASGAVDAVMTPLIPGAFRQNPPRLVRIFDDVRRAETEYFVRTRDFPIMHVVVVKNDVLDSHPGVARALTAAFECSKLRYYAFASQPFRLGLAFGGAQWEDERILMGPDPWPYTVVDNLVSLGLLTRYAWEQGLTARHLSPPDLFVRT